MIETFEIRNFRSILDLTVDFRYGEGSAPRHYLERDTWAFLQEGNAKNDRFVPVLAIYGANASGKSNIVNAFLNFQRLLAQGIGGCYFGNKLNTKYDYAAFGVVVLVAGRRFRYEISYDGERIGSERLSEVMHGKSRILFSLGQQEGEGCRVGNVFTGVLGDGYDAARLENALKVECTNGNGVWVKPFLPCLVRAFPGLTDFAQGVMDEFTGRLQVSNRNEFFISQGVDLLARVNSPEARKAAMSKIAKLLKKFDFGVREMTMERQRVGKNGATIQNASLSPFNPAVIVQDSGDSLIVDEFKLIHEDAEGTLKPLNFSTEESEGTKVIAALIGICLWALETGRTLFVDELDRSLHPFVLISLIKLFKSKRYNKTNAQLVFTAHDPTPLDEDLLRISEVGIIDKTIAGGTSFRRLCEFKGTRNITNFRKQYLSGVYSGIPFPYI